MTDTRDRLSVLVVDDDPDTADSLTALLHLAGYHARAAHGGIEAQRMAIEEWTDAVVLDLAMPGVDGWELARRLRPTTPVRRPLLVALTGCDTAAARTGRQRDGDPPAECRCGPGCHPEDRGPGRNPVVPSGTEKIGTTDCYARPNRSPDLNGWEVARWLREQARGTAKRPLLVAVTGCGSEADRRRSAEAGADLHLVKPVDPGVVVGVLRRFARVLMPGEAACQEVGYDQPRPVG